jgi:hypothetical protein
MVVGGGFGAFSFCFEGGFEDVVSFVVVFCGESMVVCVVEMVGWRSLFWLRKM